MGNNMGHCKHGDWELLDGCPKCIKEAGFNSPEKIAERIREALPTAEQVAKNFAEVTKQLRGELAPDPNAWRTGEEETRPEQEEMEAGLNSEGLTLVGSTELVLRPGEDMEVHNHYLEAEKMLAFANTRVIKTVEDTKKASDDLALISKLKKAMLAKRKDYLDPILYQAEQVRNSYKELMAPVLEAESITKTKMLAYNAEQDRIRREQEEINSKRIEAAAQEMKLKGELTESVGLVEVAIETTKRVTTALGTSGQKDNWKYEVEDMDALPREYMIPDLAMLNAIARKHHDQKKIPGVRFYNQPVIATRPR